MFIIIIKVLVVVVQKNDNIVHLCILLYISSHPFSAIVFSLTTRTIFLKTLFGFYTYSLYDIN